jgi:hypothetical protein
MSIYALDFVMINIVARIKKSEYNNQSIVLNATVYFLKLLKSPRNVFYFSPWSLM